MTLLRMLLDENAAGARVANVEHQVDRNGVHHIVRGVGADHDLRQTRLFGDDRQPVEIVGVVAVNLEFVLDVLDGQSKPFRRLVGEDLADPFGDPGDFRKPPHFVRPVSQLERRTGLNIRESRREVVEIPDLAEDIGVERDGQAMSVAVQVRTRGKRDHPASRPGCRPLGELPLPAGAQVGQRQPAVVQQLERVFDRHAVLGP